MIRKSAWYRVILYLGADSSEDDPKKKEEEEEEDP
jgi:hypothetical protein